MPYISQSKRQKLNRLIDELSDAIAAEAIDDGNEVASSGMLNYVYSRLTLLTFRKLFGHLRYWHIALIVGTLKTAADEFYARVGRPYEEKQQLLNGDIDVYEDELARIQEG